MEKISRSPRRASSSRPGPTVTNPTRRSGTAATQVRISSRGPSRRYRPHWAVRSSASREARYASGTMPAYASCHERTCTRAMPAASPSVATRIVTSSSCSTMEVTMPQESDMTKGHEVTTSWPFGCFRGTSDGALHLAGLEARRAHVETLGRPRNDGTHALDVRVPATLRAHVRVRDAVPEARALGADVAVGSHGLLLLLLRMCRWFAAKSMGVSRVRAH